MGYRQVNLYLNTHYKNYKIHVLVAECFLNHKTDGTNRIVIDHIDGVKTNNKKENLQLITNRENNSKDKKFGTSIFIGVSKSRTPKKWVSQIFIKNKNTYIGTYDSEIEASNAYQNKLNSIE